MTDEEWLEFDNPSSLLFWLNHEAYERKLRLLACAICRLPRSAAHHPKTQESIAVAERYADGEADEQQRHAMWKDAESECVEAAPCEPSAWNAAYDSMWLYATPPMGAERNTAFRTSSLALLHDIFGNPPRNITYSPAWFTPTVVALANGIYADRAFDRMPILADALEEAGCDHVDLLLHCRGDSPHVRGCWVLDLVMGKR